MGKSVLVLAAHMDDEVLGCGGTIARHVAEGDAVSFVWFTDGVSSRGEASRNVEHRRKEARDAMAVLGVNLRQGGNWATWPDGDREQGWWAHQFDDQKMDVTPVAVVAERIMLALFAVKPDVVYTHWPHDLNQDHRKVTEAALIATRAWTGRAPRLLAYEVPETTAQAFGSVPFVPSVFVDISSLIDTKVAALECYKSERREVPHPRSWMMVRTSAAVRGATVGVHYAEAFVLLREVVR